MLACMPRSLAIVVAGALAVPRLALAHPNATPHVHGTGSNLVLILAVLVGAVVIIRFYPAHDERRD
jgi:hypothetical protein